VQGVLRRVVYVSVFEISGTIISALMLAYLSGTDASLTGPLAILISTTAMSVNLAFNWLFERWESRQAARTRSLARRIAHAVGFQATLVMFLIPLIAWWMQISLLQALLLDAVLIVFFPIYMFVYNWVFDLIFGLPDSVTKGRVGDEAEAAA
jgi:uncharacterized membrane protein